MKHFAIPTYQQSPQPSTNHFSIEPIPNQPATQYPHHQPHFNFDSYTSNAHQHSSTYPPRQHPINNPATTTTVVATRFSPPQIVASMPPNFAFPILYTPNAYSGEANDRTSIRDQSYLDSRPIAENNASNDGSQSAKPTIAQSKSFHLSPSLRMRKIVGNNSRKRRAPQTPKNRSRVSDSAMSFIGSSRRNGESEKRRRYRTPSPHLLRQRREAANARERRRMNRLNVWYANLQNVLPALEDGRRLSKFETLQTAQNYIIRLSKVLRPATNNGAKNCPRATKMAP